MEILKNLAKSYSSDSDVSASKVSFKPPPPIKSPAYLKLPCKKKNQLDTSSIKASNLTVASYDTNSTKLDDLKTSKTLKLIQKQKVEENFADLTDLNSIKNSCLDLSVNQFGGSIQKVSSTTKEKELENKKATLTPIKKKMVDTACQTTPFEASKQTAEILHKVQRQKPNTSELSKKKRRKTWNAPKILNISDEERAKEIFSKPNLNYSKSKKQNDHSKKLIRTPVSNVQNVKEQKHENSTNKNVYSFAHDVLSPTVRLSNCSKNIIVDEESLRQKKSDNSCNSSLTPCLPLNISSAQKVERWLEKTAFEKAFDKNDHIIDDGTNEKTQLKDDEDGEFVDDYAESRRDEEPIFVEGQSVELGRHIGQRRTSDEQSSGSLPKIHENKTPLNSKSNTFTMNISKNKIKTKHKRTSLTDVVSGLKERLKNSFSESTNRITRSSKKNKINLPETNGDLGKIINADITYDVQAESPDIVINQDGSFLSIKKNQLTLTSNQDFNIPSDEDINDDTNFKDNGSSLKTAENNENVIEFNDCVENVIENIADVNENEAEVTETVENINKNVAENYNEHIDGINSNITLPHITKEHSYSEQPKTSKSIKLKSKNKSREKVKFKSKRKAVEMPPKKKSKRRKQKKNLEEFKPASIVKVSSEDVTPGVRRSNRKKFTQPVCRWKGEEKIYNSNGSLIGLKTLDEATNFTTHKIEYFHKNDCPKNVNEGQEYEDVTILENPQSDKNESFEPTDTQKTKSQKPKIPKNKTKTPKKKNNKDSVSQANLKKANKAKGKTIVKPILSTQKTTETIENKTLEHENVVNTSLHEEIGSVVNSQNCISVVQKNVDLEFPSQQMEQNISLSSSSNANDISDPIFYQLNGFEIIYTFNVDDAKCGNLIVYPYCTKSKVFVGEWILCFTVEEGENITFELNGKSTVMILNTTYHVPKNSSYSISNNSNKNIKVHFMSFLEK